MNFKFIFEFWMKVLYTNKFYSFIKYLSDFNFHHCIALRHPLTQTEICAGVFPSFTVSTLLIEMPSFPGHMTADRMTLWQVVLTWPLVGDLSGQDSSAPLTNQVINQAISSLPSTSGHVCRAEDWGVIIKSSRVGFTFQCGAGRGPVLRLCCSCYVAYLPRPARRGR